MARKQKADPPAKRATANATRFRPLGFLWRWTLRVVLICLVVLVFVVAGHSKITPPRTFYMGQEERRLGSIDYQWIPLEEVAPVMARSVVAAEDANFCAHWGFDMGAIRAALEEGSGRGASTLSQQVVKNVYLWHGRSWARKALEAGITPLVELIWSKRRIVEVYLNVAEFDEGVFGIEAAAQHYFGVTPADLSDTQAARLAMVLPNPKERDAANPTAAQRKRTAQIMDGAATIRRDGRADCFED
jgi:monofunctional biosynthetic peptidoglycan transglycosylase